jgi:WD40 repeat protein
VSVKAGQPHSSSSENSPPGPERPLSVADHSMIRRIGVGAYGEVWLARNVTGALRAVKVVLRDRFDHERTYEREFAGLKNFEPISRAHDSLVDILQVGRNDAAGYFYCVMELADNANSKDEYTPLTLADHIRLHGRLSPKECAQIGAVVAEGLSLLHRHGLVHRDVKPSNIIFVNGRPKLADIGLVTNVGSARSFVGTDGFIAPEGPGSPSADIYAFGKTLYEMATGRSRLDFPDLPADFEPTDDGGAFVELNEIILRACSEGPEERHGSIEELRGELLLLEAGRSVRRLRRNEQLVLFWQRAGLAALAALVLAGLMIGLERRGIESANREAAAQARQRQLVEDKERHARENLYAADMNLAQQAIDAGNYGRARVLLEAYVPSGGNADLRGFEWYYYWHKVEGDSVGVLHGHDQVVSCLTLTRDGKRLLSGSFDSTIREWSLEERRELRRWAMPGCLFASISLDASGNRLACEGGNRRFSALLDFQTSAWLTNLSSSSSCVTFTPENDLLARGANASIFGTNGDLEIIDLQYRVQKTVRGAGGHIVFSKDGHQAATGPSGETIQLWSWPEMAPAGVLQGAGVVLGLSFSPDGARLASVSQQGRLCLWDVAARKLIASRDTHGGNVIWSVAFSPDGKRLVTAGTDQTVRTWDAGTLEETHVYRGHGSEVWAAIWSADGRQIISSGKDMTIRIWDANPIPPAPTVSGVLQRPIFSRDDRLVTSKIRGDMAAVWTVDGAREILRIPNVAEVGGFSADGQSINVMTPDGEIQRRAVAGGAVMEARRIKNMPNSAVSRRLVSPSGRWLVNGLFSGEALIDDTTSNGPPIRLIGHTEMIVALAMSRDETRVVTGSIDRTARLWETATGKLLREFGNHRMGVGSADFTVDGGTVATGCWDDTIHVWDLSLTQERMILAGHEGGVQAMTFSPDERTVFGLTGTSVLKFWSVPAQREAGQIRLAPGTRQGWLGMSNDGQWLAVVTQAGQMTFFHAPREKISTSR